MDKAAFEQAVLALQGLYRLACVYLREKQDRLDAISRGGAEGLGQAGQPAEPGQFPPLPAENPGAGMSEHQAAPARRETPVAEPPDSEKPCRKPLLPCCLALDKLPEHLRAVVVLHYMEGPGREGNRPPAFNHPGRLSAPAWPAPVKN